MAAESKWKRQLRKELERDFRDKQKKKLAKLREGVKQAKAAKRARMKAVTRGCAKARKATAQYIAAERKRERERINAERDRLQAQDRAACEVRRGKVSKRAVGRVDKAEGELRAERGRQRTYSIYTKPAKLGRAPGGTRKPRKASERARESDEQVARNLPPELLPVWQRVKRRIKATDKMTRTEAFMQWVHDHSAEVQEIEAQEAERGVDEWVAQEVEQRAAMDQDLAELADAELLRQYDEMRYQEGDVPF